MDDFKLDDSSDDNDLNLSSPGGRHDASMSITSSESEDRHLQALKKKRTQKTEKEFDLFGMKALMT